MPYTANFMTHFYLPTRPIFAKGEMPYTTYYKLYDKLLGKRPATPLALWLHEIIAEHQSVRRISDVLGRFYSTLVYVRIFADRHIHTVTLGKNRHIHIRIFAWATLRWRLKRLLWRDGEGWQESESATEYFRWFEGEGFCCSLY